MWVPVVVGAAAGALVGLVISVVKSKNNQASKTTNYNNSNKVEESTDPNQLFEMGKAYMYYGYKKGVKTDYHKAYYLLTKAASFNHAEAMVELGNLCKSGYLGKYRYVEAKQWYEKGAELGNVKAICKLGYMYHYGLGTINNKEKAKELYEKAAQKGSKEAKYRLLYLQ